MAAILTYEKALVLHRLVAGSGWADEHVLLRYDVTDPHAIKLTFTLRDIVWSLGRELVRQALTQPAGTGDVRLWPSAVPSTDVLYLHLRAPAGQALLETRRSVVAAFIAQTEAMVPFGCELLDLDDELKAFNREQGNP